MRVLLVQVPTSHLGAGEKVYPLGLSRLSSTLAPLVEKFALDMNIAPDPWVDLKNILEKANPDIVALSFRNLDSLAGHQASYLSSIKTAAMLVRKLKPKARILAGGPAFSLFARRLMQEIPQIDIGIKGEGELIFPCLVEPDLNSEKIPGIIWRKRDKIILNPSGPKISMDDLPEMDLDLFHPKNYMKKNAYVAPVGIEGKRGCDLWCGYCLYPYLGGISMRLRSPVKIADEMEHLFKEYQIRLFHFTDAVVNRPEDHFTALCNELVKRKLPITWTGFFREESVTLANLTLAKKAGLEAIYFSGDALTEKGLKLLNKQMSTHDLFNASRITARLDILTMCHFLVNLPGEDDADIETSQNTLDKILEIHGPTGNLGAVIFNHVRLYPGAPLTKKLMVKGKLDPKTDLLYPVYHAPEKYNHVLHEFEARCHLAGVFSRLEIKN